MLDEEQEREIEQEVEEERQRELPAPHAPLPHQCCNALLSAIQRDQHCCDDAISELTFVYSNTTLEPWVCI